MAQAPLQDYGYNANYHPTSAPEHHTERPYIHPYTQGPPSDPSATPRALEPYPTSPLSNAPRESPYGRDSPYGPPQPQSPYHPSPSYEYQQQYTQPLPSVSSFISADGYVNGGQNGPHAFDTTGQIQPPGMRPRLTTSLSEEEGSLCFQVDVNGICVARREGLYPFLSTFQCCYISPMGLVL
jgi:protein SOK2